MATSVELKQLKKLGELADLCKKHRIDQLKLADGTCLVMHSSAFYDENTELIDNLSKKANNSDYIPVAGLGSLDETIDEELLFASARA